MFVVRFAVGLQPQTPLAYRAGGERYFHPLRYVEGTPLQCDPRIMYRVMYRVLIAVVALLLTCACVAVAIFGPKPAQGVCVDIRPTQQQWDLWRNLSGSGEMLQTEKVRCN